MLYSIKNKPIAEKNRSTKWQMLNKGRKNWWKSICEVNGYPNTFGYGALKFVIRFERVTYSKRAKKNSHQIDGFISAS